MRGSLYRGLAFVAVLTTGLAVAGCGGGNGTSTTAAISKADFLKKGNAICKKGNQSIKLAGNHLLPQGKQPTAAQKQQFTNVALLTIQAEILRVKRLGAPPGDEAKVNAIIASAQAALQKVKQDPSVLFKQNSDPFAEANKLANAYGLTACGGGGGGGGSS